MTAAIEARGLCKRRGGRWVVDELTFAVAPGEVVALVGGNGAGKSTTLAMVAGALAPDRGWVAIAGASSGTRRRVGYVPEGADPPGHLTGGELWALVGGLRGGAALAPAVADQLELRDLAGRRLDRMSLGQRRRACLAAALVGAPPALVLDEPDNGLDADGLAALAALVRAAATAGAGVLLATHDPAIRADLADRTLTLHDGVLGAAG
ncbi:MAG: ABC transporter ATP-binding protein [Kofleriaceae bacterium]